MKKQFLLVFCILLLLPGILLAQKPPIDLMSYKKWGQVMFPSLSSNGQYATYSIREGGNSICLVKSVQKNWKEELPGIDGVTFTSDSKFGVFKKGEDSLGLITLGGSIKYLSNVGSFTVTRKTPDWLIYQSAKGNNKLTINNLKSGEQRVLHDVVSYQLIESALHCKLLLQVKTSTQQVALHLYDLKNGENIAIWEGMNPRSVIVSHYSEDFAFIGGQGDKETIWYCQSGMPSARELSAALPPLQDEDMKITGLVGFNNHGTHLYFNIGRKNAAPQPRPQTVNVEVWGYEDPILQSEQLASIKRDISRNFLCVLDLDSHQATRIEKDGELISGIDNVVFRNYNDDHLVMVKSNGGSSFEYWNALSVSRYYLIKTADGTRRLINSDPLGSVTVRDSHQLSPAGKYVIWLNQKTASYCSYSVANGQINDITTGITATWASQPYFRRWDTFGDASWLENDTSVIVYDKYDIFKLSPDASRRPVCLTNNYGRKHDMVFRLMNDPRYVLGNGLLEQVKNTVVNAFDKTNMDEGFFQLGREKQDPVRLSMGPYMFADIATGAADFSSFMPLKASDTDLYIVQRMSASESPNYFVTSDFKQFTPITDTYPEKAYNWLTTELVKWKTPDGNPCDGILYKPENFDPQKKYPIIFYYYQELATGIHGYRAPGGTFAGALNIPLMVSNGYLVFLPDIHYTIGYPGRSAYNSVISAAMYLSKRPYVDVKHMGIQGHSFGGFETNYIVTHSHLFAAACSASGVSDCIMEYNSLRDLADGHSLEQTFETGRWRTGVTLWQRPDLYIENSPIFKADKVTTPLLLMADKKDNDITQLNGIEFFTALRRLHKKVWMLNYPEEGHTIHLDPKAALDFNIRMKQFFDHHLKDMPAPKWMVEGIPAIKKGIDGGLEMEPAGVEPPDEPLKIKTANQAKALNHSKLR